MPGRDLRVVTYNVHGCVGTDGRLDVDRVGGVLEALEADVVVLQELDVGRSRSGREDQPARLARSLGMTALFSPSLHDGDERYGHAVLARGAARVVKAVPLPGGRLGTRREPRSALWAAVELEATTLHVIGTHLGLSPLERVAQVDALLGPLLMGDAAFRGPRLLAGDLNVGPSGPSYWRLVRGLVDAPRRAHAAAATFPARRPLFRLDHVLVAPELTVRGARVVRDGLAAVASDHLPLVVDLALP